MSETVKIQTVTPAIARKWLSGNVDNRKLRESRVVWLSRLLIDGEWELTGDAIVFDDQGVLINGQHRLSAVVVADVSARFVVLRGVPASSQEVMDQNLSRSLGDQLHRRGVPNQNVVASALQWLYHMQYSEETGNVNYADNSLRPSFRQLLTLFEKNIEITDHTNSVSKLAYYTKVRQGPTLGIKYRLHQIDPDETDVFFSRWQEGIHEGKNDPIWRLREFCLMDASSHKTLGRAPAYRYVALVLKAWNYWRDGQTIERLNWTYSGTKKEAWPVPH